MLKPITLLFIVSALQSSVKSDSSWDHEECFLRNCRSTFNLGTPYPICGTDGNPYRNWIQLDCSNLCAKKYGFEVHGDFKGLCPGLAVADQYWGMKKAIHELK